MVMLLRAEDSQRICTAVRQSLREMWPSSYADCNVQVEPVEIASVRSLVHCARRYRLDAAQKLLMQFFKQGLAPYISARSATSPLVKILVPPVVERQDSYFNLVDGVHRMVAAQRLGLTNALGLVVTSETIPAPAGDLCSLSEMSVSIAPRTPDQMFRNLDLARFRPVGYGRALEIAVRRFLSAESDK
ncbi:ParB N-terminal domain-containing protein [Amycolatopsis umgeniensis]|uniref:ParB N-terminal domain-containing protein n=1 Tax=Amycolatopsis umgeniensis TaxID=336628 RepID=UPI003638BBD5